MANRREGLHNGTVLDNFKSDLRSAIETLKAWPAEEIRLFHHNDTDGLTSGAILETALRRAGYQVSRIALEKPYPQALQQILQPEGQIIIFADFAGQIAPLVSEMNAERNLVLILDHHPAAASPSERVLNLDADLHGLKGDRDISASATCSLFVEVVDSANIDLSHLGALGAIGDGFLVNGALSSVNREMMMKAGGQGLMRFEKSAAGERYFITLGGIEHEAGEVCRVLDTLGAAGYYSGGADRGIDLCLNGFIPEILETVRDLRKIQEGIFQRETERLKTGGLKTTEHLQWFDVKKRFAPMGVKMIGVFC
ncbi:MAG: DHH family phosphoesterase, partial [Spirochaetaceae bacterium]|nr:DHH family phosphoesterase [Spirochaetaceae bacterium]